MIRTKSWYFTVLSALVIILKLNSFTIKINYRDVEDIEDIVHLSKLFIDTCFTRGFVCLYNKTAEVSATCLLNGLGH